MSKFVIILDRGTRSEREAVQAAVKANANEIWWHWFTDTWLVGGGTAAFWRDVTKHSLVAGPSSVLVLELGSSWASFGPNGQERMQWLHQRVSGNG
jgi:hypothetical protein